MKKITKISLAILSGLLVAAAWPTRGFTPLIFIAFVPLIFLQDYIGDDSNDDKGNIFGLSFLAFLVWNSLTTWWVWNSTAAGAVAMLLLNSSFMATTFWLYHYTRKKIFNNKKGFFFLILFFLAFENLHLNWQLNWPWLNIGNVFSHNHTWIQWYEFTGIAGGTVWVLLANILAYKAIKGQLTKNNRQQSLINISLFIAVILIPIIISKIMYKSYEEKGEEVEVVVVQPNIDPWNEEFRLSAKEILLRNFDQAEPLMTENTRFVVSPESSIHENIWLDKLDYYYSIKNLRLFSRNYNDVAYVIGASTLGMVPDGEEDDFAARKFYDADEYYYSYNTAFLIKDSAEIQYHQKSRLTPGVEMMPSWWFVRPLKNFAIDLGGTVGTLKSEDKATVLTNTISQQTTDNGQQSLSTKEYKVASLICYESVFGGYVTEFVRNGANLIFVITNDGWWGDTPGHRQHFEMSKLRAIENRRSIARSANTGISGFINQKGDVVEHTNYWEPTALRNNMIVNDDVTFYSQHGDYIYRIASFLAVIIMCFTFVISILRKR
ncbi:MAG: apolipoprotein N-acyltransferase [Bacteroidales bacterium]|nr:apolipoprotein N-acyltransferase [Bacteroidales bacterium]